jgi:ankyrin repeat protein
MAAPPAPKNGRTALEGAAEHGRLDTVALLLNTASKKGILRQLNISDTIRRATFMGHYQVAKYVEEYARSAGIECT